jgi:hypothetical protein
LRIPCLVFLENAQAVISGGVVDRDDLNVLQRLINQGIQAVAEIPLHVVNGDNDREKRAGGIIIDFSLGPDGT